MPMMSEQLLYDNEDMMTTIYGTLKGKGTAS